jgi:hypothetical protein
VDLKVHGTYFAILVKETTFFSIYLHLKKADLVKNGVDSSQWTDIAAKWLMDEDCRRD